MRERPVFGTGRCRPSFVLTNGNYELETTWEVYHADERCKRRRMKTVRIGVARLFTQLSRESTLKKVTLIASDSPGLPFVVDAADKARARRVAAARSESRAHLAAWLAGNAAALEQSTQLPASSTISARIARRMQVLDQPLFQTVRGEMTTGGGAATREPLGTTDGATALRKALQNDPEARALLREAAFDQDCRPLLAWVCQDEETEHLLTAVGYDLVAAEVAESIQAKWDSARPRASSGGGGGDGASTSGAHSLDSSRIFLPGVLKQAVRDMLVRYDVQELQGHGTSNALTSTSLRSTRATTIPTLRHDKVNIPRHPSPGAASSANGGTLAALDPTQRRPPQGPPAAHNRTRADTAKPTQHANASRDTAPPSSLELASTSASPTFGRSDSGRQRDQASSGRGPAPGKHAPIRATPGAAGCHGAAVGPSAGPDYDSASDVASSVGSTDVLVAPPLMPGQQGRVALSVSSDGSVVSDTGSAVHALTAPSKAAAGAPLAPRVGAKAVQPSAGVNAASAVHPPMPKATTARPQVNGLRAGKHNDDALSDASGDSAVSSVSAGDSDAVTEDDLLQHVDDVVGGVFVDSPQHAGRAQA